MSEYKLYKVGTWVYDTLNQFRGQITEIVYSGACSEPWYSVEDPRCDDPAYDDCGECLFSFAPESQLELIEDEK